MREFVKQATLEGLTERERETVTMRFGLKGGSSHTLEQVELTIGVPREQVRQIEAKALRTLRSGPRENLRSHRISAPRLQSTFAAVQ